MTDSDTPPEDEEAVDEEPGEEPDEASEESAERGAVERTSDLDTLRVDPRVLPYVPAPTRIIRTLTAVVWVFVAFVVVHRISRFLLDYWLLESLGLESVFWTNIGIGAVLFTVTGVAFAAAVYLPLRAYAATPILRRYGAHVAAWTGIVAGWILAGHYQEYLLALGGGSFGVSEPYFGHDVGFYVFVLPALWTTILAATDLAAVGLIASLVAQVDRLRALDRLWSREMGIPERIGRLATPPVQAFLGALGVFFALDVFLGRYEVLWKNNTQSGIPMGAEYIDIVPFFSTVNTIQVTALVIFGITALAVYQIRELHEHYAPRRRERGEVAMANGEGEAEPGTRGFDLGFRRTVAVAMAALIVLDLAFFSGFVMTDQMFVRPNQPQNQEPFLEEHIDMTLASYQLDGDEVGVVNWTQPTRGEPREPETLLESETFQRAPIVPGWVSYVDAPVDLQHVERVRKTGTTRVYGPVIQTYRQEQRLRSYYDFGSVDTVRYTVDGEKRIFTSAAREIPATLLAIGNQPLTWGTRHFQYTHGFGLVMSPADEVTSNGQIKYAVKNIPPRAEYPKLKSEPRFYYGETEGVDPFNELPINYVFTNADGIKELDYATSQGRKKFTYPKSGGGIPMDSMTKRLTLSFVTGDWGILVSDMIDHDSTRVHYYRSPVKRASRIAPFLFVDCNSYAVAADGRTKWMVNALTTTKRYPNSIRSPLGDKAEERCLGVGRTRGEVRTVNYAEDSVKVTVDAMTGEVTFYKMADKPIVNAWANVYPNLFTPRSEMPESVESHLQYPLQWMHIQFDNIYHRYHQRNGLEFFNNEDTWDDADEVRGAVLGDREEIVFSYEPVDILVDSDDLPGNSGGSGDGMAFVKVKPFTPEGSANLRSLVVVYQDPENYGRMVTLNVPQGDFVHGPEQADALIDQNGTVSTRINLWKRMGSEVIRGHTLTLPVAGDILYLEPIWVKSQQTEQPEIRLVVAMYRGEVAFAPSPEGAIRNLGAQLPDNSTASSGGDSS